MTFLEICKELARLASIPGGGPITTIGQSGELLRVVNWARQAWMDIEIRHPQWNFLIKDLLFDTVIGRQANTLTQMSATNMRNIIPDSLTIYEKALGVSDEQHLIPWVYDDFRHVYMFGVQNAQRPFIFAIDPANKDLLLGGTPDKVYTVKGRYYRRGEYPSGDSSTPAFPDEFHQVIVYRALKKYAGYEAAGDAKSEAIEEYGPLMRALERDQLPPIAFGEPLA